MADPAPAESAVVQSSALLDLSPELLDMILTECYNDMLLHCSRQKGPYWGWVTMSYIPIPTEIVCRLLRQRSLIVRAIPAQRTLTVKDYNLFETITRTLKPKNRHAWLYAGLVSLKIELWPREYRRILDWTLLLSLCPHLKTVELRIIAYHECEPSKYEHHLPLDSEEKKREFARATIEGDIYESQHEEKRAGQVLLHPLGNALHHKGRQRNLNFEAIIETLVNDEKAEYLCDVVRTNEVLLRRMQANLGGRRQDVCGESCFCRQAN